MWCPGVSPAVLMSTRLALFCSPSNSKTECSLFVSCVQNALKSASDRSIAEHLTASDHALLWLTYVHLTEFDRLPSSLYDPAESGPSRLVSRESFLLPWRTQQDIGTPPDILIALFQGTERPSRHH